jgi:hypothetical protein
LCQIRDCHVGVEDSSTLESYACRLVNNYRHF